MNCMQVIFVFSQIFMSSWSLVIRPDSTNFVGHIADQDQNHLLTFSLECLSKTSFMMDMYFFSVKSQNYYCTLLFDLIFEPLSWLANWKEIQVFTLWVLQIYKYTIYTYIYSSKSVLYTYEARRLHTRVSCVQALFKVITSVEFQSKFLKYQPTKIHQNNSNFVKRHALANIDYCCPLFMHFELNHYK